MRCPRGRQILVGSIQFDTLAKYVLLEEDMYLNEELFCTWPQNPLQFPARKQRSSTNKSPGSLFNQPKHQTQGEHQPEHTCSFFSILSEFLLYNHLFFYSKVMSHKTNLSSFMCPSIASLSCLTCTWPRTLERRHPKSKLFDDREKWEYVFKINVGGWQYNIP